MPPYPGPPDREEAKWYHEWLENQPERSLVYVIRDYDAEPEYWSLAVQRLGEPGAEVRRAQAEANRDQAKNWIDRLPSKADKPADDAVWFKVGPAADPPRTCETMEGLWAEDIDSRAAAIVVHEPLVADQEHVLLASKGNVLAMEWGTEDNGRVLAIANGSFLLNLPLVNHARRPLAERVVEWIGDDPRRVAFVRRIFRSERTQPASFALRFAAAHPQLSLGGHSAWSVWPAGLPGPSASAGPASIRFRVRQRSTRRSRRALGRLLEKSKSPEAARDLLESYRRWRLPRS